MPYVTQDRRVQNIVAAMKAGTITRDRAAAEIKALGFLDWEIAEALNS